MFLGPVVRAGEAGSPENAIRAIEHQQRPRCHRAAAETPPNLTLTSKLMKLMPTLVTKMKIGAINTQRGAPKPVPMSSETHLAPSLVLRILICRLPIFGACWRIGVNPTHDGFVEVTVSSERASKKYRIKKFCALKQKELSYELSQVMVSE